MSNEIKMAVLDQLEKRQLSRVSRSKFESNVFSDIYDAIYNFEPINSIEANFEFNLVTKFIVCPLNFNQIHMARYRSYILVTFLPDVLYKK